MNTPTKPNRSSRIDDLVLSLVLTAHATDTIKNEPAEVNAALAMCEIAVSLPGDWFTKEERTLVGIIVKELGVDPESFIDNIRSGTVSYYAKAADTCLKETGHAVAPLSKVVAQCLLLHAKECGSR